MPTPRHLETTERVTLRSILTDPLIGPIIGIVFVLLAGFGLVFPILPLFARSFGVGNDGAGLLIATFGFARLFGDLIGGTIVDRRGERWTAIVGMSFLAVCSGATGAAPNFVAAVVLWGLAGVGSATVFASLFSYILKAAPDDRVARTLSFFYGAFNVGVIVGGAAGGFIADAFGLETPLYAYTVILIVGIVVYLRFVPRLPASPPGEDAPVVAVPEAATVEAPRPSGRVVRDLLRVPGFLTTLFLNLTYLWIVAALFNTLVPLFAHDEIGMSTSAIGAMFAVGVAVEFLVLFPAGTLADRYGGHASVTGRARGHDRPPRDAHLRADPDGAAGGAGGLLGVRRSPSRSDALRHRSLRAIRSRGRRVQVLWRHRVLSRSADRRSGQQELWIRGRFRDHCSCPGDRDGPDAQNRRDAAPSVHS